MTWWSGVPLMKALAMIWLGLTNALTSLISLGWGAADAELKAFFARNPRLAGWQDRPHWRTTPPARPIHLSDQHATWTHRALAVHARPKARESLSGGSQVGSCMTDAAVGHGTPASLDALFRFGAPV